MVTSFSGGRSRSTRREPPTIGKELLAPPGLSDVQAGMLSGTSTENNVYSIPEKDVNTLDYMSSKMSSSSVSNPAQTLTFYETTQCEYSIASFIETYQNELPQLVMIKKGYLRDTDGSSLDTDQILRIHGVHSERRVLAMVTKDSRNCFGFGDVTLSIPVTFPIPMCCVQKSGSSKTARTLKKIIKKHTLPMTVQLIDTTGHDIQLTGKMVLLRGDVKLKLLKEYEGKYIYGNPVKTGKVYRNVISVPSCEPTIKLSVITGLASHNNEHWQSTLELMDRTVTKYIKFDGKLCNTEIVDCSSPDLKIEKLVVETFTEPGSKHSSGSKEKVLDETFTEPGNIHYSGPKEKVVDEAFTEPGNTHSSGSKMKYEDITPLSEDDHVYVVIPIDDSKANNKSSYQDSLLFGNNDGTIPLSQGHALSNCKIANMDKKNPDPGNSMYDEPDLFYNQYKKDVSMGLPSTQKSEEIVAVGKSPASKIRSPDIGGPCDIKFVKPVNSSFDIYSLSVQELGQYLHILNIGQYAGKFSDTKIDGSLLKELDEKVLVEEFGFKRFEALTLVIFARHGYLPKTHRKEEPYTPVIIHQCT